MLKALCDICGKPCEPNVCWRCGRKVCKEHFDFCGGVCSECLKGGKKAKGKGEFVVPDSERPTTVTPGDIRK